jgi:maltose O-acetyltransferase
MREEKLIFTNKTKLKILHKFLHLLDSKKRKITIEYQGKELNTLYGLQKDAKGLKLKFREMMKLLIKGTIQIPIFHMVENLDGIGVKNKIYRMFGAKIGKEVYIAPGVYMDEMLPELIEIGDGTIIGKDSSLLTHEFTVKHASFGRIKIGKQVTVGAQSIIKCGIKIGDGAVVAMDSLVNKDVPKKEIVGGIPAKKIKKLKNII